MEVRDEEIRSAAAPWSEHESPDGTKYYYNRLTSSSTWVKPPELTSLEALVARNSATLGASKEKSNAREERTVSGLVAGPRRLAITRLGPSQPKFSDSKSTVLPSPRSPVLPRGGSPDHSKSMILKTVTGGSAKSEGGVQTGARRSLDVKAAAAVAAAQTEDVRTSGFHDWMAKAESQIRDKQTRSRALAEDIALLEGEREDLLQRQEELDEETELVEEAVRAGRARLSGSSGVFAAEEARHMAKVKSLQKLAEGLESEIEELKRSIAAARAAPEEAISLEAGAGALLDWYASPMGQTTLVASNLDYFLDRQVRMFEAVSARAKAQCRVLERNLEAIHGDITKAEEKCGLAPSSSINFRPEEMLLMQRVRVRGDIGRLQRLMALEHSVTTEIFALRKESVKLESLRMMKTATHVLRSSSMTEYELADLRTVIDTLGMQCAEIQSVEAMKRDLLDRLLSTEQKVVNSLVSATNSLSRGVIPKDVAGAESDSLVKSLKNEGAAVVS